MGLDAARMQEASDLVFTLWRQGRRVAALPEALRPQSRAEGYAIQALLERRSAKPLFGWKIAATSLAGQAHIGVDGPLAGRLLAEQVSESGATLPLGSTLMHVAEAEFAFRMARTLPPRTDEYRQEEVMAAVGTLHPAIEVPDSRYDDFVTAGAPQLLADNACADRFVLAPAASEDWRRIDLATHPVQARVGSRYTREGQGANVLGDPRIALTWIANELSRIGVPLAAGQVVTTGTCVPPLEIQAGDTVSANFGVIGSVTVSFSA